MVEEDEKLKHSLEEAILKEVKIEILAEDEPLAANPPPFCFSLVVDTLTFHVSIQDHLCYEFVENQAS